MIIKWISDGCKRGKRHTFHTIEKLRDAIQRSIELEHATIPAYLYAWFSIKDGTNIKVAELIHTVVMQEMLHLCLASNLLLSIGGTPSFIKPGFIPSYPSKLPMNVIPDLVIPLAPLSKLNILNIFMKIEMPSKTIFKKQVMNHYDTIASFYSEIANSLKVLCKRTDKVFSNPQLDRQLGQEIWPISSDLGEILKITCLDDAIKAINLITDQGEGEFKNYEKRKKKEDLVADPYWDKEKKHLSHYFAFKEIVIGRELTMTDEGIDYKGLPIFLDENNVLPAMVNPTHDNYVKMLKTLQSDKNKSTDPTEINKYNSQIQDMKSIIDYSSQFIKEYNDLLANLHLLFFENGLDDKRKLFSNTIGQMSALHRLGHALMGLPLPGNDRVNAGPSFEWDISSNSIALAALKTHHTVNLAEVPHIKSKSDFITKRDGKKN